MTCPACGAAVKGDSFCSSCGLDQRREPAAEMRALSDRIRLLDEEIAKLRSTRDQLAAELIHLQWTRSQRPVPGFQPQLPVRTTARSEWTVERVRAVLLWVGAALLAASALTFTAVAWSHLGDGGRALLLGGVTGVFAGLALATRRRLPASAEAFTALTVGLLLIDWHALRRAGVADGLSVSAWWAAGSVVTAACALALGRATNTRSSRVAVATLLPLGAELLVATWAGAPWSTALGLALIALMIVLAWRVLDVAHNEEVLVQRVLQFHAGACWVVAAINVAAAAVLADTLAQSLTPAVVIGALALAPTAMLRAPMRREHRDALGAIVIGVPVGALMTIGSSWFGPQGLLAWTTFVAAMTAVLTTRVAPQRWLRPAYAATTAFGVPGVAWAAIYGVGAAVAPLAWYRDAWRGSLEVATQHAIVGARVHSSFVAGWPAVWALLAGVVPIAYVSYNTRRHAGAAFAVALGVLAIGLMPVVADVSARTTLITSLAVFGVVVACATFADRLRLAPGVAFFPGALLAAASVAGWAAVTRDASIVSLSIALAVTAIAARCARSREYRVGAASSAAAAFIALAGVWTAAFDVGRGPAGYSVAVAAGVVLLFGTHLRAREVDGFALEVVAYSAAGAGAAIAGDSWPWLAATFTAFVPAFVVAALRRERATVYGASAAVAALGATWTWLAVAHVPVVEAYTLPLAALALGGGLLGWRAGPARSWLALGPGLAAALGPTLVLGIAHDDAGAHRRRGCARVRVRAVRRVAAFASAARDWRRRTARARDRHVRPCGRAPARVGAARRDRCGADVDRRDVRTAPPRSPPRCRPAHAVRLTSGTRPLHCIASAGVAQSVEQLTRNEQARGSSPLSGSHQGKRRGCGS